MIWHAKLAQFPIVRIVPAHKSVLNAKIHTICSLMVQLAQNAKTKLSLVQELIPTILVVPLLHYTILVIQSVNYALNLVTVITAPIILLLI